MSHTAVIALVVVIAAIVVVAAIVIARRRRSEHLREHFGPEYNRTVQMQGNPAKAEAVLLEREQRVKKFSLRPLPAADRERYAGEWASVQRRFVDDPSMAV